MTTPNARCVDPLCTDGPRDDEDTPAARWATLGWLCRRCHDLLEQRLAELPAKQQQLRQILGGVQAQTNSENKRTKGSPPVPLNLAAHDHLEHLHATVVSWVRLVREERGLRGPDRNDVAYLAPWLLGQMDWITDQRWVGDLADEMRDIARVADSLTGARPGWHTLPAPCPGCGEPTLGRWDGAHEVGCTTCGERWPEEQYPRLVSILAADVEVSVTAREAAQRAGVKPATFRQWVSRGKVKRVGTVDGQARYSTTSVDAAREDGAA